MECEWSGREVKRTRMEGSTAADYGLKIPVSGFPLVLVFVCVLGVHRVLIRNSAKALVRVPFIAISLPDLWHILWYQPQQISPSTACRASA